MEVKKEESCNMADALEKALDQCFPSEHAHCKDVKYALTAAMHHCNQYNIQLFDSKFPNQFSRLVEEGVSLSHTAVKPGQK